MLVTRTQSLRSEIDWLCPSTICLQSSKHSRQCSKMIHHRFGWQMLCTAEVSFITLELAKLGLKGSSWQLDSHSKCSGTFGGGASFLLQSATVTGVSVCCSACASDGRARLDAAPLETAHVCHVWARFFHQLPANTADSKGHGALAAASIKAVRSGA